MIREAIGTFTGNGVNPDLLTATIQRPDGIVDRILTVEVTTNGGVAAPEVTFFDPGVLYQITIKRIT